MISKSAFLLALLILALPIAGADIIMPPQLLPAPSFTGQEGDYKFTIINASDYGNYDFYYSYYGGSVPSPNAPPSAGSFHIYAVPKGTPESDVPSQNAVRGTISLQSGQTSWRITSFDAENKTIEFALVDGSPGPQPQPYCCQFPAEIWVLIAIVAIAVVLFAVKFLRK